MDGRLDRIDSQNSTICMCDDYVRPHVSFYDFYQHRLHTTLVYFWQFCITYILNQYPYPLHDDQQSINSEAIHLGTRNHPHTNHFYLRACVTWQWWLSTERHYRLQKYLVVQYQVSWRTMINPQTYYGSHFDCQRAWRLLNFAQLNWTWCHWRYFCQLHLSRGNLCEWYQHYPVKQTSRVVHLLTLVPSTIISIIRYCVVVEYIQFRRHSAHRWASVFER